MFAEFRSQYPKGTIKTEMLAKVDGMHTFRAEISNEGIILATATGCDPDLETAEDRAIKRALAIAGISESYRLKYQSYAQIETTVPHDPPRLQQSYQPVSSELPEAIASAPKLDKPMEHKTPEKAKPVEHHVEALKPEPPEFPMDLSDLIAQTDVEMQRVGWNKEKGKEYLMRTFRKPSRQLLTARELQQFLAYLKSLPSQLEDQEF